MIFYLKIDKWKCILLAALICLMGPFSLEAKERKEEKKRIEYEVTIVGIKDRDILKDLKSASNLERLKGKHPISIAALKHRAESDIPELLEVMHAHGFYEACTHNKITFLKEEQSSPPSFAYSSHPISKYVSVPEKIMIYKYQVTIYISTGPDYILASYSIQDETQENLSNHFKLSSITLSELGIKTGTFVNYRNLKRSEDKLINQINTQGYPLAKIVTQELVVDQAKKTADDALVINSGPQAHFGKTTIIGLSKISQRYANNRITWKQGEMYQPEDLETTQRSFFNSGLFTTVTITHGDHVNTEGEIPMYINVTESKYRNLTLGGTYHLTWEGVGAIVGWKNRNIGHIGITLEGKATINQKKQKAVALFEYPDLFTPNQNFFIMCTALKYRAPNYLERNLDSRAFIERHFNRYLTMSLGVKVDLMETSRTDNNQHYTLLGIPYHLNYQSKNDLLLTNPHKGGWISFKLTPYTGLNDNNPTFLKGKVSGATYFPLWPNKRLILAQSATFATIIGDTHFSIPAPYRFYAGSEHHLRGYPYQKVSPLDELDRPIGGRSMALYSLEIRLLAFEDLEFTGFFDAGNVWFDPWPDWDNALLKSMGFGFRYFTFIGPLSVDIGFPMNKRPNIDRNYQVYFSIGQPF